MKAMTILGVACGLAACGDGGARIGTQLDMARPSIGSDGGFVSETVDLASSDDFPPALGIVYAHTATTLYTVDQTTFDLTAVGDFGGTDGMTDLAVTPDGHVYTISRTSFYKVDRTTGVATSLFSGIATSNVALTFRDDGTLLAADQKGAMRSIDPTSGTVTELGSYGTGYDTAGDLVAISDGTLYGVSTKAPGVSDTSNVLIKVDPTTAKATTVGPIGYTGVFGIAYSGGKVLAFTKTGQIIRIDPSTGAGTLVSTQTGIAFYGAGTSPLAPVL